MPHERGWPKERSKKHPFESGGPEQVRYPITGTGMMGTNCPVAANVNFKKDVGFKDEKKLRNGDPRFLFDSTTKGRK